jgi:hypothetical protein
VTVGELSARLDGTIHACADEAAREVLGGYASDLLSDVIAHAREGDAWVTLQRHVNVVAVAQLKGIAVVVLVNGREPDPDTVARAAAERVPVVSTPLAAFDAAGALYALGLRGSRTS